MHLDVARREIVILAGVRTAFGTMSGALKDLTATDLAVPTAKAALERAGVAADDVDHVIYGNVLQTANDAIYLARHIALKAGVPQGVPALGVNRLCGSGFQAVITAAEQILTGQANVVSCGGTESMSRRRTSPTACATARSFGKPPKTQDLLWECLTDTYDRPAHGDHRREPGRAARPHPRPATSTACAPSSAGPPPQAAGRFADELVAGRAQSRKGTVRSPATSTRRDATPRGDGQAPARVQEGRRRHRRQRLGHLRRRRERSSSPTRSGPSAQGLRPLARLVGWGVAGCDPTDHGHRPRPGRPPRPRPHRPRPRRHVARRGQRGLRPAVPRLSRRSSGSTARSPTSTAAPSPSGTRSAPPGARITATSCTSCAAASGTALRLRPRRRPASAAGPGHRLPGAGPRAVADSRVLVELVRDDQGRLRGPHPRQGHRAHHRDLAADRGPGRGDGERVGNTALDQLLVNLQLAGVIDGDLSELGDLVDLVSHHCGVPIPVSYPVFGKDAFRTGTGVHAAAVIKAQAKGDDWLADRIYSGVPAGWFGRRQEIEIGHQSGVSNVRFWLQARKIEPTDALVAAIFEAAKKTDRLMSEAEVLAVVQQAGA
jgi:acetyl-CoA acyltransferase 2